MSRPLRVAVADGWYHCLNRGIERHVIFTDDHDYGHFLRLLGETVEQYRFRMHAYCLMDNHYHLIVQTPEANLSRGMQWLGLSYSSWFNARHSRVGHLFQGRFKSVSVEDGQWALELSWYVHLNPVRTQAFGLDKGRVRGERAGILPPPTSEEVISRLKRLREYPWSSYRAYAGYRSAPTWLTTEELLRRSSQQAEERHRAYRERVKQMLKGGGEETRLEQFREVAALGSATFVNQIKRLAAGGDRETERRSRLRKRLEFAQVVEAVEAVRGEPRDAWIKQHGDWGKWLVLSVARAYTGQTLGQLGEVIGGKDYAAVCMGLKRFQRRMNHDKTLQRTHQAVVELLNV